MSENPLRFLSANGKRTILIVEDEAINREILGMITSESYNLLFAETGAEAIETVRTHYETLSLVLLDLNLPDMHGLEVLRQFKADPLSALLPVIVMTADKDAEVESLTIGAIDFIPKPYPQPKVILARILRTIELSEDRDIIRLTERDQLTGLYNQEYFFRYADQYDLHHRDQSMDALMLDINHFHVINERYGKAHADDLLRRIAAALQEDVDRSGGILCRRAGDTFLIYAPHGTDYGALLEHASVPMQDGISSENRVRLRMGVYARADKELDIERRFDRAKMAADTVKNSYSNAVALYDSSLQEKEMFDEQLMEDFSAALRERQLAVFYQPKFDIRPDIPRLASAEALVRWHHPRLGMISPGVFIPLFEKNGLIPQVDSWVWREASEQIRDWKTRLGISVPVSVNVSRIDLFDPDLVSHMKELTEKYGLAEGELLLEITESAYTESAEQIIRTVRQLRDLGFRIEMDDFGSGYSSLNMLSTLPIDALKLDMQFIRSAFSARKDTRLLEAMIRLAGSLEVPTIAEGVETEEQMLALKAMGCDIAQGYYFSKPVPAQEFEAAFLTGQARP